MDELQDKSVLVPDVEAQTLRLGAFAFLEKPVSAGQLIDVVKRALARSPIRDA